MTRKTLTARGWSELGIFFVGGFFFTLGVIKFFELLLT